MGDIGDLPCGPYFPDGRLPGFQRHKLSIGTSILGLGKMGDATLSGLWRVNSADLQPQGHRSAHHRYSGRADLAYPDLPSDQDITSPGRIGSFRGYGVIDLGRYNVPVLKSWPYVRSTFAMR
jgi:hypothetical protein